jgi:quinol monooxygenase YgiN
MIGMTVDLTITPGSGDAFERAFAVQAVAVRAKEPGNRLYALLRSKASADAYTLVEIYDDEAALEAHRAAGLNAKGPCQYLPTRSAS